MTNLRSEIVNKSFFQFLSKGYDACTLKDLEQATGLTKGAFYYYFTNKEGILKEGLDKYVSAKEGITDDEFLKINSLKEYIVVVLAERERQSQTLEKLFGTFIVEELYFQLVLEVESLFPEYRKLVDELSKKRLSRWEHIILKAKQSGEINEKLDTSVLARNLMSVSTSMLNIELMSSELKYVFTDMRLQFEQYYMLIKKP